MIDCIVLLLTGIDQCLFGCQAELMLARQIFQSFREKGGARLFTLGLDVPLTSRLFHTQHSLHCLGSAEAFASL